MATEVRKEIFPGYTVEKLPEPAAGEIGFAYQITGPKTNWKLLRNRVHPHMLFPVPENVLKGSLSIKGHKWFTDKVGELKAL